MDLLWTQPPQQLGKSYWHLIACLAAPFRRQVTKCQRKTCCDLPGEVGTSDPTLACGEVADMWNLFRQVAKKSSLLHMRLCIVAKLNTALGEPITLAGTVSQQSGMLTPPTTKSAPAPPPKDAAWP